MLNPLHPHEFARIADVSRETLCRLEAYVDLLQAWNRNHNLVSEAAMADLWRRHVLDSAQLVRLLPDNAKTLVDLGSGAGFPGLVLALLLEGRIAVTLYEATAKKAAFLQVAAERMGVTIAIEPFRIDKADPHPFDVVTARARAPLPRLLDYAYKFLGPNSVCLFLKGRNVGLELTDAHKYWNMQVLQVPSITDSAAIILQLRQVGPHVPHPQKGANPGGCKPKGRRR